MDLSHPAPQFHLPASSQRSRTSVPVVAALVYMRICGTCCNVLELRGHGKWCRLDPRQYHKDWLNPNSCHSIQFEEFRLSYKACKLVISRIPRKILQDVNWKWTSTVTEVDEELMRSELSCGTFTSEHHRCGIRKGD